MPNPRALPFTALSVISVHAVMPSFTFHPISPVEGNFYRETLLPADIDKDGDMDFYSGGGRGDSTYWFENAGGAWIRRLVSDSNEADVGAALLDVDGDGWPDKVSASFWYRNPGFAKTSPSGKSAPFGVCRYGNIPYVHDIYAADMDGDGYKDILTIDYSGIRWFKVERDSACRPWTEHMINGNTNPQQHGGIAAGDLDGDGDMDVSRLDRWYENVDGKGLVWKEHINVDFGTLWPSGWGLSGRAVILDLDGDGYNDIIQTECDLPNGRVAWFSNKGGKGLAWERHIIKDSTDGQDFHSLAIADFDGDGDLDIFSSGSGSSANTPQAYIWENLDGKGGSWQEHIVYKGKVDHEGQAVDMDGDGDMDILLKTWGEGEHYYLENQLVPNPNTGLKGISRVPAGKSSQVRIKPAWMKRFLYEEHIHDAGGRRIPAP